jgi:hypothetical protein
VVVLELTGVGVVRHVQRRVLASVRGGRVPPRLLLDPSKCGIEAVGRPTGTREAINLHLIDALPDDNCRHRGGEASLEVQGRQVRCVRRHLDGGDDAVGQGNDHSDGRGEAPVLACRRVDAVGVGRLVPRGRSRRRRGDIRDAVERVLSVAMPSPFLMRSAPRRTPGASRRGRRRTSART